MMMLPFIAGISERTRKASRNYNIRMVFRSGPVEKQANVVYEIPRTCRKVYVGETKRRLGTRLKEHKDACVRCHTNKSTIAEHAWSENHPINRSGIY